MCIDGIFTGVSVPGLHYQHNFLTSGKKALLRAVGHLLDEWEILSEVKRPMLLWREGTPIQHPYPNGWWEPSYQHCSPKVCCDCVTLTDTMKRGNISGNFEQLRA